MIFIAPQSILLILFHLLSLSTNVSAFAFGFYRGNPLPDADHRLRIDKVERINPQSTCFNMVTNNLNMFPDQTLPRPPDAPYSLRNALVANWGNTTQMNAVAFYSTPTCTEGSLVMMIRWFDDMTQPQMVDFKTLRASGLLPRKILAYRPISLQLNTPSSLEDYMLARENFPAGITRDASLMQPGSVYVFEGTPLNRPRDAYCLGLIEYTMWGRQSLHALSLIAGEYWAASPNGDRDPLDFDTSNWPTLLRRIEEQLDYLESEWKPKGSNERVKIKGKTAPKRASTNRRYGIDSDKFQCINIPRQPYETKIIWDIDLRRPQEEGQDQTKIEEGFNDGTGILNDDNTEFQQDGGMNEENMMSQQQQGGGIDINAFQNGPISPDDLAQRYLRDTLSGRDRDIERFAESAGLAPSEGDWTSVAPSGNEESSVVPRRGPSEQIQPAMQQIYSAPEQQRAGLFTTDQSNPMLIDDSRDYSDIQEITPSEYGIFQRPTRGRSGTTFPQPKQPNSLDPLEQLQGRRIKRNRRGGSRRNNLPLGRQDTITSGSLLSKNEDDLDADDVESQLGAKVRIGTDDSGFSVSKQPSSSNEPAVNEEAGLYRTLDLQNPLEVLNNMPEVRSGLLGLISHLGDENQYASQLASFNRIPRIPEVSKAVVDQLAAGGTKIEEETNAAPVPADMRVQDVTQQNQAPTVLQNPLQGVQAQPDVMEEEPPVSFADELDQAFMGLFGGIPGMDGGANNIEIPTPGITEAMAGLGIQSSVGPSIDETPGEFGDEFNNM